MTPPIDIVLERLRNVQRHGDYWMASCPTREDYNPSLSITEGEDGRVLLKDFGGDTTEEIVAAMGLTMADLFPRDEGERKRWMDDQRGSRPARRAKEKVYKEPEIPADATFREGAIRWFAKRGIGEETMKHYGVYTEGHYFFLPKEEQPSICIPYVVDGKPINVKYRSAKVKDHAMVADGKTAFWNLDNLAGQTEIVIVEGEFDAMAIYEATGRECISPPNGNNSVTPEVMESAKTALADETRRVILAGDNDDPGRKMMDDLANRIGRERCFRVEWPEGCKDANDVLLLPNGKETIDRCITNATPYETTGIVRVHDNSDDYWALYTGGLPRGISTGIPALDAIYTVAPGQFTVATGVPNAGKTTMIDNLIVNIGQREGWRFGICSMENRRLARHQAGIAQKYVGKPFKIGMSERMTAEEAGAAEEWMDDRLSFIKTPDPTIDAILHVARAMVYQSGINGLVIDPWNRIHHPQSMNAGDYVAETLNKISEFADRFSVHVWLVAHPTKVIKNPSTGEYPVLDGYDISGSAHFNNMADYILSMWRSQVDFGKLVEAWCKKSRYDEIATVGCARIGFDVPSGRYYDPAATAENGLWRPKTFGERMEAREANEFGIVGEPDDAFLTEAVMLNA
jgi:twinkle protein